jgi:hypothetical protein
MTYVLLGRQQEPESHEFKTEFYLITLMSWSDKSPRIYSVISMYFIINFSIAARYVSIHLLISPSVSYKYISMSFFSLKSFR